MAALYGPFRRFADTSTRHRRSHTGREHATRQHELGQGDTDTTDPPREQFFEKNGRRLVLDSNLSLSHPHPNPRASRAPQARASFFSFFLGPHHHRHRARFARAAFFAGVDGRTHRNTGKHDRREGGRGPKKKKTRTKAGCTPGEAHCRCDLVVSGFQFFLNFSVPIDLNANASRPTPATRRDAFNRIGRPDLGYITDGFGCLFADDFSVIPGTILLSNPGTISVIKKRRFSWGNKFAPPGKTVRISRHVPLRFESCRYFGHHFA